MRQLGGRRVPARRARARTRCAASHIRLPGVDVVVGDLARPETLDAALSGVDRVFLASPAIRTRSTLQGNLVQACKRAGVARIVKVSVAGGPDAATQIGRWHWTTEKQIEASGLGFTMLPPEPLHAADAAFAPSVATSGSFALPCGAGEVPLVDSPGRRGGRRRRPRRATATTAKIYDLTGPEALSFEAMADATRPAIGRKVDLRPRAPGLRAETDARGRRPALAGRRHAAPLRVDPRGLRGRRSDTVQRVTGERPAASPSSPGTMPPTSARGGRCVN